MDDGYSEPIEHIPTNDSLLFTISFKDFLVMQFIYSIPHKNIRGALSLLFMGIMEIILFLFLPH